MTIKETLSENTDEILALLVVTPTVGVLGYQAVVGMDVTMPTTLAGIIIGYYFGKKVPSE